MSLSWVAKLIQEFDFSPKVDLVLFTSGFVAGCRDKQKNDSQKSATLPRIYLQPTVTIFQTTSAFGF